MFGKDKNVAKITARTVSVGDSEIVLSGAVRDAWHIPWSHI